MRIPFNTNRLTATLRQGLTPDLKRNLIVRNRIQTICTSRPCLDSESARKPRRRTAKTEQALDSTVIDSISRNLINDLYTKPASSSKSKVTVDDVLALRPSSRVVSPEEFNKLKDVVASSFNVTQLKGVLRAQNVPASGKKSVLVNQIMLLMDLEVVIPESDKSPLVEDPYSAAEANIESEDFPSNRRELFFILGSEGDSLRQIEKEKNVRISINIADETYTIRGPKDSIQEAKMWIQERVAVTEEAWDVSSYGNKDLVMDVPSELEEIARRSETFVSVGDENTLIIAGRSSRSMEEAKRLFDIKLQKSTDSDRLLLLHQEDELSPLGMFPLFDSVTMTVDEKQRSFFRICQAGSVAEGDLSSQIVYPVHSTPSSIGTFEHLGQHLKGAMDQILSSNQTLELSAHFGHVLFQNMDSKFSHTPLSGSFDTMELEEWLKSSEKPYFFDSLPFFKAVSKLPLVGPKSRTIEVDYIPTSRSRDTLIQQHQENVISSTQQLASPIRIIFELNNEGQLCIQSGKAINKVLSTDLMMLGQPTDIQIRSELNTKIGVETASFKELLNQTELLFSDKLQCPSFFSFRDLASTSSTPAAAQLGLGSLPTHTLSRVLFRTSGVFDYRGLPLVASNVGDQYGQVRKQELKLLPTPLRTVSEPTEDSLTFSPSQQSPLEHWGHFMKAALQLNGSI